MLKQSLSQKMLQKLSPQQIQLMKLLQIPTATLEQRIKEELEANPALEEGDNTMDESFETNNEESVESDEFGESDSDDFEQFELDDYLNEYMEDDPVSYRERSDLNNHDDEKTIPISFENTFHDYLEHQLGLLDFRDKKDEIIARQIVGSIDEDGYLRRELTSIIDDLIFSQNVTVTEEEIKYWLKKIQAFDPPGTGAFDLRESLEIQLKHKLGTKGLSDEEKDILRIALRIVEKHFITFSKKHYTKLKRQVKVNDKELKIAIDEILKLNPKPATGFIDTRNQTVHYIIPDFVVENDSGELQLSLNSKNSPILYVNNQYRDMLLSYKQKRNGKKRTKGERETVKFIKQKIDSAKWFIDAIQQRHQTMYNTMYSILQYQYEYFLTGDDKKLRPMILKDIAEITGLDISTISRVANSKYVQTEFGTKRLKDFFSESLLTKKGKEVSTLEVKNILSEIISNEDKKKPLSDEKLKRILRDKGYLIARRTVAKYREHLNIPVARLRKEL